MRFWDLRSRAEHFIAGMRQAGMNENKGRLILKCLKKYGSQEKLVGLVLFVFILLRLIHFLTYIDDPYLKFRVGDELEYHTWAMAIADGHLLRDKAFFTTPLYAYFLGFIYFLVGQSLFAARLANHILGIGTIYFIYRTAKTVFPSPVALLPVVFAGLSLAPLIYETFPEKTSLVYFMTALSLFLITRSGQKTGLLSWLLAGVAAGLTALAHALYIIFVPVVYVYVLSVHWKKRGTALKVIALFSSGFLLAILPAAAHNYIVDKDFVLICYNGGQNFYAGNNSENFYGTYRIPSFVATANLQREEADYNAEAQRRTGRNMKPSEISRFWYQRGWEAVKENPELALRHYLWRLKWIFNEEEWQDTRGIEFFGVRLPVLRLPLWHFGLVSFLGLTGFFLTITDRRFILFNALLLSFALLMSFFFVLGRYRLALIAPLSILACAAIIKIIDFFRKRQSLKLAAIICLALFLGWMVFADFAPFPKEPKNNFFVDYYNQGNMYLVEGRKDLAIIEYRKALENNPNYIYAPDALRRIETIRQEMGLEN